MKQKSRRFFLLISLLIFPLTLYYFSPYVILVGASEGIVIGSFIMFTLLFLFSIFFGFVKCLTRNT